LVPLPGLWVGSENASLSPRFSITLNGSLVGTWILPRQKGFKARISYLSLPFLF